MIPIDEEIKPLTQTLTEISNVKTDSSCFGHDNDNFAWIEFTVTKSQLDKLLSILQIAEDKIKNKNYWIKLNFILSEMVMNVPNYNQDNWYKLKLSISGHNKSPTEEEIKGLSKIIKQIYHKENN